MQIYTQTTADRSDQLEDNRKQAQSLRKSLHTKLIRLAVPDQSIWIALRRYLICAAESKQHISELL